MIFGRDDGSAESAGDGDIGSRESETGVERVGEQTQEPAGGATDERVREFETRLDDLEAELEQTGASVRSIEGQQETLSEEISQLDDRVRRLLGVYDQAAADANPFTDGDSSGFGVVGEPPDDIGRGDESHDDTGGIGESHDDTGGIGENHNDTGETGGSERARADATGDNARDDTDGTGFEELKSQVTGEDPARSDTPGAGVGHEPTGHTDSGRPDGDPQVDGTLETVPETYAADIITMEWLSMLVRRSGPAGALKSIEYYRSVGWVSESVQRHLEAMLSGPGIDAHVEPESTQEPELADHLESYAYIRQLETLGEADRWGSA